ncbi:MULTISPECIES: hypothetical protein [Microbulbifer]|uniref:hypothetical protein n=1 Tax=Microbulbifer TaxID=48073 RepID=UPI001E415236|nr:MULTISPECIES: hypothetical protein [Microbulbifer]UHQ54053.1 hypothetical protein LVE68_11050 [Microbulbifer sp. YPW16]
MGISTEVILSLVIYKVVSLLVGSLFGYLGYRLFISGVWGGAGELQAAFRDNRLVLKEAAPGTFFAICGVVIIAVTLYKGLEFEDYHRGNTNYVEIAEEGGDDLAAQPKE